MQKNGSQDESVQKLCVLEPNKEWLKVRRLFEGKWLNVKDGEIWN